MLSSNAGLTFQHVHTTKDNFFQLFAAVVDGCHSHTSDVNFTLDKFRRLFWGGTNL